MSEEQSQQLRNDLIDASVELRRYGDVLRALTDAGLYDNAASVIRQICAGLRRHANVMMRAVK